jgi:hypothetical protein
LIQGDDAKRRRIPDGGHRRHFGQYVPVQRNHAGFADENAEIFEGGRVAFGQLPLFLLLSLTRPSLFQFYPALVKFLLRFDDSEVAGIPEMITELRECLLWPRDSDPKLRRTVQQSVFFLIGRSLKVKKAMFSGWLRAIQAIDDKNDHHPIDLIVLVVMIKTNDEKASVVESVVSLNLRYN